MNFLKFFAVSIFVGQVLISSAEAQKIKVEKVKGNRAVVQFSGPLAPGEVYDLGSVSDSHSNTIRSGSRKNIIGLSGELSSLSTSAGSSTTSSSVISVTGRYGWNMVNTEYGGIASFGSVSGSGTTGTSFAVGGFFDYNLQPHRSGVEMLYGFGGEATYGSGTYGTLSSVTSLSLYPLGFVKWFFLKTSTCLRADLGYRYQTYQTTPDSITISGIKAQLGLAHYF